MAADQPQFTDGEVLELARCIHAAYLSTIGETTERWDKISEQAQERYKKMASYMLENMHLGLWRKQFPQPK